MILEPPPAPPKATRKTERHSGASMHCHQSVRTPLGDEPRVVLGSRSVGSGERRTPLLELQAEHGHGVGREGMAKRRVGMLQGEHGRSDLARLVQRVLVFRVTRSEE